MSLVELHTTSRQCSTYKSSVSMLVLLEFVLRLNRCNLPGRLLYHYDLYIYVLRLIFSEQAGRNDEASATPQN